MTENVEVIERQSPLHALLSLILPGLGQAIAGEFMRGFSILASIVVLGWLSIWTIAQRARFPDLVAGRSVFLRLGLACLALLIFVVALRYLLARFVLRDAASQAFSQYGLVIFYALAVLFLEQNLLSFAGNEDQLGDIFGGTAVFSAAALAGFWLWQVFDAARIGGDTVEMPSWGPGILLACVVIFSLGWRITDIDLPKAISEYRDTQVILRRIFWPWEAAFEYEQITVESDAKIQAPCPPGATGPEVNQPLSGEAWVVVTPTCGELTERDLRGNVTLGTELTITGGGYLPGQIVEIKWENPIGNAFTPRGVGETRIEIGSDGGFESNLYIPEWAIPSTAEGDQVHTLIVIQSSAQVFTGRLSREMNLAFIGILETIMIGLMATFFGIIFAFPISFLAARNIMSPIVSRMSDVVGGLLGVVPAVWLAAKATGFVSGQLGGLEEAPIQIALVGLILILGLSYFGYQFGGRLFTGLIRLLPGVGGNLLTALGLGFAGAALGYVLGIGFSRGIVSISQGAEIAALTEMRYAYGGAIILGILTALLTFFRGSGGMVSIGMVVYSIMRTIMNVIRSIEPIIWAIVAAIWVGLGPFAGTIALTLHTIAALGKLYSESIESIDPGPIEALQATGANRLQTVVYAVVPQIFPPFISFTIYRWDINVRLSTIIGLVGGGGIGFLLIQWIRQFQYENAGIAVWLITITVSVLDYVSSNIRERYV